MTDKLAGLVARLRGGRINLALRLEDCKAAADARSRHYEIMADKLVELLEAAPIGKREQREGKP